jgi:hypothetical protein
LRGRISLGLDEAAPAVPMGQQDLTRKQENYKSNVCFWKKEIEPVQRGRSSVIVAEALPYTIMKVLRA